MNNFQLKDYQKEAVDQLVTKCQTQLAKAERNNETRSCLLEAPTGSGKTIMMGEFIKRFTGPKFTKQIAFLWLAPNKLQDQSYEKIKNQLSGTEIKCIRPEELKGASKIGKNQILFLNWASINRDNNRLRAGNERAIDLNTIAKNTKSKYKIISIIDEGHNTASGNKTKKAREIIDSHLEILVTATAGQLRNECNDYVSVDSDDPVDEGMICESVRFNSSQEIKKTSSMERKDVIDFGLKERQRLAKLFQKEKIKGKNPVNPLMLIQLKQKTAKEDDDDRNEVEKILAKHGITYKNKKLAVYLSDDNIAKPQKSSIVNRNKINLDHKSGLLKGKKIDDNDSTVEVLIFKQAIALGWDCPRASILCLFRDLENVEFGIQVIGRLMRMPDHKHYSTNEDLNHAYVIANFERIKLAEDLKKLVEQDYLKRKEAVWKNNKISLPRYYKKKISNRTNLVTAKFVNIFLGNLKIQKKFKQLHNYPVEKLKKHVSKILDDTNLTVEQFNQSGDAITGKTKNLKDTKNQRKEEYKKRVGGFTSGFTREDSENAIEDSLYRSFREKPFNFGAYTNSNPEDDDKIRKYVTSPDTDHIISECFDDAKKIYKKKYPSNGESVIEKGSNWEIPKIVPHSPDATLETKKKYVMEKLDKAKLSTIPEQKFACKLSSSGKVKWWYKNGDSGRDNFAIPYYENGTLREFFVDFIVKFSNGDIGIFDTKSGNTLTSDETKAKAKYLANYIKKENKSRKKNEQLIGGIVANTKVEERNYWTGTMKYNKTGKDTLFDQTKVNLKWTDVPI